MESTDIFLDAADSGVREVKIAPVVVFNVLDHFIRRADPKQRVIGTLLGRQTSTGTVHISDSFPLPHSENGEDEVAVDSDYFMKMYELQRRVTASEELVGWYATGTETDIKSVIIHEFYGRQCVNPVHVLVDASLKSDRMDVRAFVSTAYKIGSLALSSEFQSIPACVKPDKAEHVGLDVLFKKRRHDEGDVKAPVLASEIDNLENSMQRLLELLDTVGRNVDAVVTGKIEGDVNTGRFLAETLTMVPRMNNADFERLFGDNMRDLLMVAYLCKLTKSQLVVGEKLLGIDVPVIGDNNSNSAPNPAINANAAGLLTMKTGTSKKTMTTNSNTSPAPTTPATSSPAQAPQATTS